MPPGRARRWSKLAIACASCRWRRGSGRCSARGRRHERATLTVVRPGLLTTIQDLGRWGHQATGVPVAGPMDLVAHRLANALVGNRDDAATLEVTLIGPELTVDRPVCGGGGRR